ncbi:MAG: peptidase [Candidatus Sericytochromatia bacterium]|nr:MAG: peptidase [Candidatus Sericytochromatia bacterium]
MLQYSIMEKKILTDKIFATLILIVCFTFSAISLYSKPKEYKKDLLKTNNLFNDLSSLNIVDDKPDIAIIDISGPIMYSSDDDPFSTNLGNANKIISSLEDIKNENIKAVLIRLNSPGGTASASQSIYQKIMSLRKNNGIKFFALMQDVAASGAYYIASACDKIYCSPSTITGSIGVIMQVMDLTSLGNKIGYQTNVIKSGKYKDIGNSFRKMSDDEKKLLQEMINDTYNEFLKAVSNGRNMDINLVRKLADGRIYTGNQAYANRLVDKLGTQEDAINDLAKLINVSGTPKVKNYNKPSWEKIFESFGVKLPLSNALKPIETNITLNKIPLMLYI